MPRRLDTSSSSSFRPLAATWTVLPLSFACTIMLFEFVHLAYYEIFVYIGHHMVQIGNGWLMSHTGCCGAWCQHLACRCLQEVAIQCAQSIAVQQV